MDERRVADLPTVGGNPFYLARLTAGVLSSGGTSAGNPMPNMTNRNAVFSPPQDLVQEFKIHTATYDASIGHAAGAMTNVSMKSGGNSPRADFHPWLLVHVQTAPQGPKR